MKGFTKALYLIIFSPVVVLSGAFTACKGAWRYGNRKVEAVFDWMDR